MVKAAAKDKGEVTYEIVKHLGKVGSEKGGWQKEVNLVSWNGKPAKLDIRDWNRSGEEVRMGKGITLGTEDEWGDLLEILEINR